jgi:hypothetical protein
MRNGGGCTGMEMIGGYLIDKIDLKAIDLMHNLINLPQLVCTSPPLARCIISVFPFLR